MSEGRGHPSEIREDMKAARRLEFWNIGWTLTYVAALGLAMGSSQAMRTAWIEDLLGLIPPIVFLLRSGTSDARRTGGFITATTGSTASVSSSPQWPSRRSACCS